MPVLTRRLFVALPTPPATRDALVHWTCEWSGGGREWRWVQPAGIHLTLRFYGDTPEERLGPLIDRLRAAAADQPGFEIVARGWGVFPSPSRPRVLWAGITGDVEQLQLLAERVEGDARALGFDPEERRFHAHVTLARVGRPGARPRLPQRSDPGAPVFGPIAGRTLVLYQSHLGPGGARYDPLLRARLGVGDDALDA